MSDETFKVNMEAVVVRGGMVQAIVQLSADDTDVVCQMLRIKDEDRGTTILVKDFDMYDAEDEYAFANAHWEALNRVYELK
jgi:hypothetical protein